MTTNIVQNIVYICLAMLMIVVPSSLLYAQTNNPADISEGVVVSQREDLAAEVQSTTTQTSSTPWYKVEKLSGVVDQGDFVVGPGRAEIEVKPGQTVVYEISVANRISDNRTFKLEVEDISGTDDASQAVVFMGEERGPYGMKDYLSFSKDSFTLGLGERARIPVTITIPKDAEPGGYYGGVLVSTVKGESEGKADVAASSPIIARIGTLFFITVPGEISKSGETKGITIPGDSMWYEKGPIDFNILFENTGSIHLNPYGEVRITNIFGEEVGYQELEPWFVLPKSLRSRDITWNRDLLFGRYEAKAYINRGYDDIVDEVSVVFWVLPWKIVGGVFLALFIIIFSIRFFFRTFEFKRKG